MLKLLIGSALIALACPAVALAANPTSATLTINGSVSQACSLGSVTGSSTFAVTTGGSGLIDTATGLLGSNPQTDGNRTITGSWCNTKSTISVAAAPMVAQNFAGTPPSTFSKAVNYTASVSGWAASAATSVTGGDASGAGSSTNVAQTQTSPQAGDITVALSNFATGGGASNRLVADPSYQGSITVTLAVAP